MASNRIRNGSATIRGRLATDPQLKHTSEGAPVVSFRLADNKRVLDQQTGEWQDAKTE